MTDKEWLEKDRKDNYPWATDDQWACILMLYDLFKGKHHLPGIIKNSYPGIVINARYDLSTWDSNYLTRAVLLAHDQCIRLSISPSNTWYFKIMLWKRKFRDGSNVYRHPTIEEVLKDWRVNHKNIEDEQC